MGAQNRQRTWVGVAFVLIGLLILLENINVLDVDDLIENWWPLIIVLIGVIKLRDPNKSAGTIIIIFGLVFLSATLDIVEWENIWRWWPVLLILLGLSMLFRSRGAREDQLSEESMKVNAIFAGVEREVTSTNLKSGELSVIFGGMEIDMSRAQLAQDGCTLDLSVIAGGIELRVPSGVRVLVMGSPIFGGVENKTQGEWDETKPTLRCHCNVIFGGVEIKS